MNIVHELKVNNRFRLRLGLLLLGIVGLLASAFFFFNHQAAKEASKSAAVTAAVAAPATTPAVAATGQNGKTGLTIIDTTVSSGDVQKLSSEDGAATADTSKLEGSTKKHKLRSSSHRMIASRFGNLPPPPSGIAGSYLPARQVEMWSGTQKAVVTVAPGTKFEE